MGLGRKLERSAKRTLIRLLVRFAKTEKLKPEMIRRHSLKRILIIRQHNQMGDMLLAVPALRAVKESFPHAETGVVTSTLNRGVLLNNPYIDFLFSYNKKNPFSHCSLIRKIRSAHFDLVIVLHTVSFSLTSVILAVLSGAKLRAGSTSAPFGHKLSEAVFHLELPLPGGSELDRMNETEHNLFPLSALGIKTDNLAPLLVPGAEVEKWAENFVSAERRNHKLLIVVHPGAGKRENIWPPEKFSQVVNKIGAMTPVAVLVVEGPRDAEQVAAFCGSCKESYSLLKRRGIDEVASVMKRADLVMCNDTGVMHVACAAGARTLAVFGPTDPSRWAPRCNNLHVVRAPAGKLEQLKADRVFQKAVEILELKSGAQGYL